MRSIHRHVHFDFHTMPGIYDFNRNWDAAAFAQRLSDSHVDYVNIFASCNIGFTYFPSKVGIPYPEMKGDMFGDALSECHKRNIGVTAYINIGLMHEQLRRHPEWCRMDKNGRINFDYPQENNFFRMTCFNNPGYQELLLGIIREISSYDIDGLFCDCMSFFPCRCPSCIDGMKARGYDPAKDEDAYAFDREVIMELVGKIKAIIGPDRYSYFNGMPIYEYRNMDTHIELECLPSSGWGYDFFWPQVAYARNIQDKILYMTGRFQLGWGDFGGYKTKASIENDLYDGLCNNASPSVGDHLHPAEIEENGIFEDIKDIYARFEAYEPYTEGAKFCSDIGVITDAPGGLGAEYSGLARMMAELKQSIDIVHESMDISRFKVVILPDNMTVKPALKDKLEKFISEGGKILSAGNGGITPDLSGFALDCYPAVFDGEDECNSAYFTFTEVPEGTADMRWSMYNEKMLMTATAESYQRAAYVKPYFNRHWDYRHGYCYTPPEKATGQAAAVCDGRIGHICFGVFTAYNRAAMREHKRLVAQLLAELLPQPLIKPVVGIPSTARVTLTKTCAHTLLHVKVTYPEPRGKMNIVEEHNVQPAGAVVAVRGEFSSVSRIPDMQSVDFKVADSYTYITLPQITGYDMFLLK